MSGRRHYLIPDNPQEVIRLLQDELAQSNREVISLSLELEKRVAERTVELEVANEELKRCNAQLEIVNKELEAFSYSVSHDLRAPLRTIDGFTAALQEEHGHTLDESALDYLKRVRVAAGRMGQLIDQMLNLARISRTEIHKEEVDLSELVRTIAEDLKSRYPDRKIEFIIEESVKGWGDRGLLIIAFENLLGNSVKYTSSCSPAVIEFKTVRQGGSLHYLIKDNGVGFDMNYAGKLFGAFQRLHSDKEFEGTGVGLATVKRIVTRHGGRIWAEAAINKGATFFFEL